MNKPLYEFEIKAFYCLIELYINDILVFCHYEENGSIWIDWPINQYILDSGLQNFELKIIPYKNHKTLSEKVQLEIGVHAINVTEDERTEIIEKHEIEILNKDKLPVFIYKGIFNAWVPYENKGWKDSLDLKKEEENKLLHELLLWNSKLLDIYRFSKIEQYNEIYKEREEEFAISHYNQYVANTNEVFHSKFKDLVSLPDDLYRLVFYANNKIVSVKLPNELPGFTYEPKIKDEEGLGVSLILYFHRKNEGEPLEIIR